ELLTTTDNSGVFAAMPRQLFPSVSFSTTDGNSLIFGNAAFGNFSSSSITPEFSAPGLVIYDAVGTYSCGTNCTGTSSASLTVTFLQVAGSITDHNNFNVPSVYTTATPELTYVGLLGLGMVIIGV